MNQWTKRKGFLKAPFYFIQLEPLEREHLGNSAANLADHLMQRARTAPRDELAEMTGILTGHSEAPTDPGLARVLPDFYREGAEEFEGENALARQLNETDLIKGKLSNLSLITEAVGPVGGVTISLEEDQVPQYLSALTDMRNYYYGQMQSYLSNPDISPEQVNAINNFIDWLAFHQESLLYALTGETFEEE